MLDFEDVLGDSFDTEVPSIYDDMDTINVMVDADMARRMLQYNIEPELGKEDTNRKTQKYLVADMGEAMLAGDWYLTHQGVAFDTRHRLIDGAHRLKALVRAADADPGIRIPLMITINVPAEGERKLDVQRRRTLSDVLTQGGLPNTALLSSMGRIHYLYEHAQFDTPDRRYWVNTRPKRDVLEQHIHARKDLFIQASRIGSRQHMLTPSACGVGWMICGTRHPEADMSTFMAQLAGGEHIGQGDPTWALRRWAMNNCRDGSSAPWEQLAVFIKAFAAYRVGRKVDTLMWRSSKEPFPRP